MRVRVHAQSSKLVSYSAIRGRHQPPFFVVVDEVEKARQTCFADVSQSSNRVAESSLLGTIPRSFRFTAGPTSRRKVNNCADCCIIIGTKVLAGSEDTILLVVGALVVFGGLVAGYVLLKRPKTAGGQLKNKAPKAAAPEPEPQLNFSIKFLTIAMICKLEISRTKATAQFEHQFADSCKD